MVIIYTSLIFDRVLVDAFENKIPLNYNGKFYYLVGLLPIVDTDQKPIDGSELIKISFGFAVTFISAIVIG